jgi:hypothetical protein
VKAVVLARGRLEGLAVPLGEGERGAAPTLGEGSSAAGGDAPGPPRQGGEGGAELHEVTAFAGVSPELDATKSFTEESYTRRSTTSARGALEACASQQRRARPEAESHAYSVDTSPTEMGSMR